MGFTESERHPRNVDAREEPFADAGWGIRGTLHRPAHANGDAWVFSHGAGSNSNAPLLVQLAREFAAAGHLVLRHDLPFRQQRPHGPPFPAGAARDREGIERAAEAVRAISNGRVFLAGHSYGGRQSAMLAAEKPGLAAGLLLLSYPLHPPRRPDNPRTSFFGELRTPALFAHGTRDPFGTPQELREAMSLISGPTDLLLVGGAAHDLARAAGMAEEILGRFGKLIG
ncbi:MAG TPA: alpha/beta fold hydrolase [Bryobacteraceae bacterium]|nr:alpha/beta fold hydrolase [Bryobacteraceae bacterium]